MARINKKHELAHINDMIEKVRGTKNIMNGLEVEMRAISRFRMTHRIADVIIAANDELEGLEKRKEELEKEIEAQELNRKAKFQHSRSFV